MNNTKSKTRILAEKIQAEYGGSLVKIMYDANQYVSMGMFSTVEAALEYMSEEA